MKLCEGLGLADRATGMELSPFIVIFFSAILLIYVFDRAYGVLVIVNNVS